MQELDMKLGVIKLSKNIQKEKAGEIYQSNLEDSSKLNLQINQDQDDENEITNLTQIINQMFNGKIPVFCF